MNKSKTYFNKEASFWGWLTPSKVENAVRLFCMIMLHCCLMDHLFVLL